MAHKLRAGAATDKTDFVLQMWPPRHVSFMRMLGGRIAIENPGSDCEGGPEESPFDKARIGRPVEPPTGSCSSEKEDGDDGSHASKPCLLHESEYEPKDGHWVRVRLTNCA